jgi:hypothetical protein
MRERDTLADFGRELAHTPLAILLFLADLAALAAIASWVVDDANEGIVLATVLVVLLVAQYLVFRSIWRRLFKYERAAPRLRFSQVRQGQMYHDSPVIDSRTPTFEVVQAWFTNQPASPTEFSVARGVTAKVTLRRPDGNMHFEFHGQWAVSNAPGNVGFQDFSELLDLSPGHTEAKLLIALKYPSDVDAYAFTREGWRASADRRYTRFAIPQGDYTLSVDLLGLNVSQQFSFHLRNPGSGGSLVLEAPPAPS